MRWLLLLAAFAVAAVVPVTAAGASAPSGVGCPPLFPQGEAAQALTAAPSAAGYWLVGVRGDVASIGGAPCAGSLAGLAARQNLRAPIVGMAALGDGSGYWLAASDGGVFNFGKAALLGSLGGLTLNRPIVGMAAKRDGSGYWLVAADGGVFAFGTAGFFGSTGNIHLNAPVVGIAATPDGGGYWLAAADGGVFAFGDAPFMGSAGNVPLRARMGGIAATPRGDGYWLLGGDGGVFNYGAAGFFGSGTNGPFPPYWVGIAPTPDGKGYHLAGANGVVVGFGDAPFSGSVGLAPACTVDDVQFGQPTGNQPASAGGTTYAAFVMQRRPGAGICSVDGAPPVAALTSSNKFVPNHAAFAAVGPAPVYLAPGDVASFAVSTPACDQTTNRLAVALPLTTTIGVVGTAPLPDCGDITSYPVISGLPR